MESASKKIVPYSDVSGTARARNNVFGERDLQRHIGKHMDIRSRLKLAVTNKTYYAVGKEDIQREHGRTNYITKKVFSNNILQDYIGSYLGKPKERSRLRSATMTSTKQDKNKSEISQYIRGRGTWFNEDYKNFGGRYLRSYKEWPGGQEDTRETLGGMLHRQGGTARQRAEGGRFTDFRIQYPDLK